MIDQNYPMAVMVNSDENGGGFIAIAPDLPGCMADGETPEEAIAELRSAIGEWIDEAERLGRAIPAPGSQAKNAAQEAAKLADLMRTQDKLLTQTWKEMSALKKSLTEIQQKRDAHEAIFGAWFSEAVPSHVPNKATSRKAQRLSR